jgi:biotin operon repressor
MASKVDTPFTKAENIVIATTHLSEGAKLTYQVLKAHRNNKSGLSYPSIPTVADERRCAERSIKKHIQLLRDKGLVKVQRHGRHNEYTFPLEDSGPEQAKLIIENLFPTRETPLSSLLRPNSTGIEQGNSSSPIESQQGNLSSPIDGEMGNLNDQIGELQFPPTRLSNKTNKENKNKAPSVLPDFLNEECWPGLTQHSPWQSRSPQLSPAYRVGP